MLHDKKGAFVQKAQRDNTSYSQAGLQRGRTEGRDFALYTRETSNRHQRSQRWTITKAGLTLPVVFRKDLWRVAHSNKCFLDSTLHYFFLLPTLLCRGPDTWYEEHTDTVVRVTLKNV